MAHSSWLEISSLTSSEASTIFTSPLGFCPAASIAESYFLALSKIDCALWDFPDSVLCSKLHFLKSQFSFLHFWPFHVWIAKMSLTSCSNSSFF
jgi:hypothetical protein